MAGKKSTNRRRSSIRVCYLIDVSPERFQGGGQTHLVNLVRCLERPGLAVAGPGLNIFGGQGPQAILRFFWMIYVIPQVIFHHFFRRRFDILHAHSLPAMAAGKILSLTLGIPMVVTVHGSLILNQESPWRPPRRLLNRIPEIALCFPRRPASIY